MKTALVTGANRGIGLELCRQLKEAGYEVIAACRDRSPELEALGLEIVDGVDVTDTAGIATLERRIGERELDLLVNNAGILKSDTLDTLDVGKLIRQFEVNAVGPLLVTRALRQRLRRGAKVAIVTSLMGSIADNTSGGYYGYRMSKAAVNMAGVSLARDLQEQGITVLLLHPGMVATGMTSGRGMPAEEAARGLLARIEEATPADSGSFRHASGKALPW
ncbi:MAG: short-chain dehydrogenase [Proteobacteria bacterium]|jgi:NAD(P)-dependent dehydrogenase (short-subunit alcohol dehydrogenase family)|nr:short-chain dehydrogenase [Pseudomonadota bacterium]